MFKKVRLFLNENKALPGEKVFCSDIIINRKSK